MSRRNLGATLALLSLGVAVAPASAQITESNWNAALTGSQSWQLDDNWSTATFPNDPDRVDSDQTVISNVIGANLSVDLAADLNVNVGDTDDVTVAALRLGGTLNPVATTVSSTGANLVFQNNELNDASDPDNVIPAYNFSRPLIISGGVAGSTNVISAPIVVGTQHLDIGGYDGVETTNDLLLSGPILFEGTAELGFGSLNMEAPNNTLTISSLNIDDVNTAAEGLTYDFAINQSTDSRGTVIINGLTGAGLVRLGSAGGNSPEQSTIVLNSAASVAGGISVGRANFILAADDALGSAADGAIRMHSVNGDSGVNLMSDNDSRVVNADVRISQWLTVAGDHTLTLAGDISQSNARGIVNNVAAGKELVLGGTIAADNEIDDAYGPIPFDDSPLYFDGSGVTRITGALINHDAAAEIELGPGEILDRSFGKRGTGALYLEGSVQGTPNLSTYSGFTYVDGGNLHLASVADLGATREIKSTGGAIGLVTGTVTGPDSAAFLSKIVNRANAPLTIQGDVQRTDDYSSGGLMLAATESAADLDFTSGPLANARDMSVAAPEQGMTYTGTVTPGNATYRFGGGSGVITLPNSNQLTGANSLVVMNGHDVGDRQGLGGVAITGTNNYTGTTTIQGRMMRTNQDSAAANGGVPTSSAIGSFNGTTLTVTTLADGGVASSIGASTSDAENLHLQGGTLRYEGGATSTDRLFTIGTRGGTVDSSGTGALVFSNTGALGVQTAGARDGITSADAFGFVNATTPKSDTVAFNLPDTSDLVPGMQIMGEYVPEGATITGILSPTRVQFDTVMPPFTNFFEETSTLTFIDAERTFTLTGDNTGDNILSPIIGDSLTNLVHVEKTGVGKWILDAVNTYTGDTIVDDGTLSITNAYLEDTADVHVESGAVFDLDFGGFDDIDALFLAGASAPVGTHGGFGSGADFESAFFTGTGVLNVMTTIPSEIPGDYNNDGVVNAADYTFYRDNLGQPGGTLLNDPAGGVVGSAQYDQWVDNYGATEPPAAEASLAVPEPASALLGLLAAAGFAGVRRRA